MSAREELEHFKQSQAVGVWDQISKMQLLMDMKSRVNSPVGVDQGPTSFCGPAAIVYELVRKRPEQYVRICQSLFETGSFEAGGKRVSASDHLRASQAKSGMSSADWMLMATMRESENLLFKELDDGSGDIALGITTPWEMKGWARHILGYTAIDFKSTALFGEFDAIRSAEKAVNNGGSAFLLVDSAMMENQAPTVGYPNHWITFVGGLLIEGDGSVFDTGHISFQCQTWGELRSISISEGDFEDGFWGVTTGVS